MLLDDDIIVPMGRHLLRGGVGLALPEHLNGFLAPLEEALAFVDWRLDN